MSGMISVSHPTAVAMDPVLVVNAGAHPDGGDQRVIKRHPSARSLTAMAGATVAMVSVNAVRDSVVSTARSKNASIQPALVMDPASREGASVNQDGGDSPALNWMAHLVKDFPTVPGTDCLTPNVNAVPASLDSRVPTVRSKDATWIAGNMARVRDQGACVNVDGLAIDVRIMCATPSAMSTESASMDPASVMLASMASIVP